MKKVLLLLWVVLTALNLFAVTNNYYVSTTGSNSNDGSSAHPWQTLAHADSSLSLGANGTVVHVLPGTYAGPITTNTSGTSSQRIVFISDTKGAAKITNANWQVNGSYVDINGFDLTAPGAGGYAFNINPGSRVHILGNNMHDFTTGGCGSYGVVNETPINPVALPSPSSDNWIIGNVIRHGGNYNFGPNNCVTLQGIYSTGPRDIITDNVISGISGWGIKRNGYDGAGYISNNTIFNNGGGIDITEKNDADDRIVWDFNTVNNNIIVNNGIDTPKGCRFGIDFYHVTGTHNLVSNNLVYGNLPSNYGHHDVTCIGGTPISGSDADGTAGGCPSTNAKSDANTGITFAAFHVDSNSVPDPNYSVTHYKLGSGSAVGGGTTSCASSPGLIPCTPSIDFDGIAMSPISIGAFVKTSPVITTNDYFVSTTGNDSNSGSFGSPWATITHAASALSLGVGGTTVHVAQGTYNECVFTNRTGTASQRITYISDVYLGAKISCNGSFDPASSKTVWANGTGSNTRTGDYAGIVGFEIVASTPTNRCTGISSFGAFAFIARNYIHDILGQALAGTGFCGAGGAGIELRNNGNPPTVAHDSIVDSNVIDHIGIPTTGDGNHCANMHGIYIASPRQTATNNIISRSCGWGIHMFHDTYQDVIANNVIINNYNGGILVSGADGFTNDNTTVDNNIVANNGNEPPIEERWGATGSHNEYHHNVMYGNTGGNTYSFTNGARTTDAVLSGSNAMFVVYSSTAKAGDFHLVTNLSGSTACASGGITPCVPHFDFNGDAWSNTVGAYNFGSSSGGTTPPPPPPTGLTATVT